MAFPDDDIDLIVEAAWGADPADDPSTWTWVELDGLFEQQASIRRGRADEGGRTTPASVDLEFDNPDGNLTPDNPSSTWWPNVRRGTPLRVIVGALLTFLRLRGTGDGAASTPDHASLDITGDIDIRIDITPDAWGDAGLARKYNTVGDQRSWGLRITGGLLELRWSPNGTFASLLTKTSTAAVPTGDDRLAVRATLDVNNGAVGNTVAFYTAPTSAGPWTQLGTSVVTAGTTSVHSGTATVEVGRTVGGTEGGFTSDPFDGKVHSFELRSGIAGTAVANPDFTALEPGQATFVDGAGRTWTVTPDASIDSSSVRFSGEIASIEPVWPEGDVSEGDDPGEARVTITAAGILRRLQQGQAKIQSALRSRIPAIDPVGYWPLEDGAYSYQAASWQAGAPGAAGIYGIDFARDDTLPGSGRLPTATVDVGFVASPPIVGGVEGTWSVVYAYHADSVPGAATVILQVRTSGNVALWTVEVSSGLTTVRGYNGFGTEILTQSFTIGDDVFDGWQWIRLQAENVLGAQIAWRIDWYNIGGSAGGGGTTITGQPGRVTNANILTVDGWSYGHLFVRDDLVDPSVFPANGFAGETPSERLARLADEHGLDIVVEGDDSTTTLGAQPAATPLDVARDVATTDLGYLTERRDRSELTYRGRSTLYNQTAALVLDAAADEIAPPFRPIHDDQRYRNDVTVSRVGGSSFRQADVGVEGTYDTSVTVNVEFDVDLPDQAGWRLHLGTWNGMRYAVVTIDLAIAPHLIDSVCELVEGDRIQIIHLPPQHPSETVDLLIEGGTETMTPSSWLFEFACSPAGPWSSIWVLEDDILGRADTIGSELGAGIDADDTSLSLVTTAGPVWIDSGTRMNVPGTSGGFASTPDAAALDITGDIDIRCRVALTDWTPSGQQPLVAKWNVTGNQLSYEFRITTTGILQLLWSTTGAVGGLLTADSTVAPSVIDGGILWVRATMDVVSGANRVITFYTSTDATNDHTLVTWTQLGATVTTAGTTSIYAGTATLAVGARSDDVERITGYVYAAAVLNGIGGTVVANPNFTGLALGATSFVDGAGRTWTINSPASIAGGTYATEFPFDLLVGGERITVTAISGTASPQAATVTRSVNGVVKSHSSGADVVLADPAVLAL